MKENLYSPEISGEVRWADNGSFCYFHPNRLPFKLTIEDEIREMAERALMALSKLDGKVSHMSPDERDMITRAFTMKESAQSSAIEGTGTTMSDLYLSEIGVKSDPVKMADNQEVMNYKSALEMGLGTVDSCGEISQDSILDMHRTLIEGVRGAGKNPGSYRDVQVFVGSAGDDLDSARFVPPTPAEVPWLMGNWFDYVNLSGGDRLIRAALAHYQFETIHPFTDGNGRMGRLIIMLMLHREKVSDHPVLYISEFFNKHRTEYIDTLNGIRERDDFNRWLKFFLRGMMEQAQSSIALIDALDGYRKEITEGEDNMSAVRAMELLFRNPYIRTTDLQDALGVSATTAGKVVIHLESRGIIREITGQRRNRIFVADRILRMLEDGPEAS